MQLKLFRWVYDLFYIIFIFIILNCFNNPVPLRQSILMRQRIDTRICIFCKVFTYSCIIIRNKINNKFKPVARTVQYTPAVILSTHNISL